MGEILFKAQMQALEQLLCFGNGIIANYTDYDHCEFDTCFECPNMNITYLEPPPKIECDEALPHKPCDDAWITAEYGQWSNTSADLLAACQACPDAGAGAGAGAGGNGCPAGLRTYVKYDGSECWETPASAFLFIDGDAGCCEALGFTTKVGPDENQPDVNNEA